MIRIQLAWNGVTEEHTDDGTAVGFARVEVEQDKTSPQYLKISKVAQQLHYTSN